MIMTVPITLYICSNCQYTIADKEKAQAWFGDMDDEFSKHYCSQDCNDDRAFEIAEEQTKPHGQL
ncbi:hypothetical protein LCGC14_1455400 [marine sediment metagenome]|uniref:Uncharacterized protein n=1 Tax=marine sediment metagenome TaxID=412755 RepID=A0A0F9K2V0_9ZZZZ